MDYTQEQIDKLIADAKAEATTGLFTEDELTKRVTSEVDRRVETGIQKGLETQKGKWAEEAERQATLTAEQKAQEQMKTVQEELASREKAISRRANTLDAKDMLLEAGVPKSHHEKVLGMVVSDDSDITKSNVAEYIDLFTETKTNLETQIKTELSNVPAPKTNPKGNDVVTKESFTKLSYSEQVAFKASNPEQYKQFIT